MDPDSNAHRSRALPGLIAVLCATLLHAWWLAGPCEDAFISFRFARNLANGHGLVWNIGEPPVEGFTNFFWVMIAAGLERLGLDVVRITQGLGVLASLATILLMFGLGRSVLALRPSFALLACTMVALAPPMPSWSTSGLETTFFGTCLLAGCGLAVLSRERGSLRHLVGSCLCLLVATLTRPEGFGVFLVVAALVLAAWPRGRRQGAAATMLLTYIAPFAGYFMWRYQYFGALLPNTFYAKTGGTIFQYLRGVIYCGYFALHYLLPFIWVPLLLLWEGRGQELSRLRDRLGAWLFGAVALVYTLYVIYVGGDYLPYYRFFVPVLPFFYLLIAVAMQSMWRSAEAIRTRRRLYRVLTAASLAMVFMHATPLAELIFSKPRVTQGGYAGVRRGLWHTARLRLIGEFFNNYKRDDSESLYTNAIGIISYVCPMKIYDQHGLVDPVVARQPSRLRHAGWGIAGHEKDGLMRALSQKPTFIMFSRDLTREPLEFPEYPAAADVIVRANYHIQSIWLKDVENQEEGYFNFLERNDRPRSEPRAPATGRASIRARSPSAWCGQSLLKCAGRRAPVACARGS